jgi:hypothetical protein
VKWGSQSISCSGIKTDTHKVKARFISIAYKILYLVIIILIVFRMWKEKAGIPKRIVYKDLPWVQRHPRFFVTVVTSFALLTFFSKPIYDTFIADARPIDLKSLGPKSLEGPVNPK